jgi:hypothetical protein
MSQPNIFQEVQDDIERQRMEALWRRYGIWLILFAVLAVAVTGGVTYYRNWEAGKSEKASANLNSILMEVDPNPAKQVVDLSDFAKNNPGIVQSTFASFHAAGFAAKQGDKEKAVALYDAIAADTKTEPAFRQLADLLAVQTQLDSGDPGALGRRLQPLLADNAPWRIRALEFDGYLALRAGDKPKAIQDFTELSRDPDAGPPAAARANIMLRYIGE